MNGPLRGKVMLRLAGDVHNYMRHEVRKNSHQVRSNSEDEMCSTPTLIVSGGGGAFLHPTHCLGAEDLQNVAGTAGSNYTRKAEYPSVEVSKGLSWLNLTKFRARNWRFDVIGGLIYLALAHSLFSDCSIEQGHSKNVHGLDAVYILQSWFHDTSVAMQLMITRSNPLFVLLTLWFVLVMVDSGKRAFSMEWAPFICYFTGFPLRLLVLALSGYFCLSHHHSIKTNWKFNGRSFKFVSRRRQHHRGCRAVDAWCNSLLMRYSMLVADSPQTQVYLKIKSTVTRQVKSTQCCTGPYEYAGIG